jgi:hypothetical protein
MFGVGLEVGRALPPAARVSEGEHGFDALAHPARGFRLGRPDRLQGVKRERGRHFGNRKRPKAWEGVGFQRGDPLRPMLGIAILWGAGGMALARDCLKGALARQRGLGDAFGLGLSLLRHRVRPGLDALAQCRRLRTRRRQRDRRIAPQAYVAALAVAHDAQRPEA